MFDFRMRAYRWGVKRLFGVAKPKMSQERYQELLHPSLLKIRWDQVSKKHPRVWFHAASVGELESLWSVVEELAKKPVELVLTVFSDSAIGTVQRLAASLSKDNKSVLFAGFSPAEGDWEKALGAVSCDLFVTAKYEAWPELWASLGAKHIPLVVVNAQRRGSLKIAKRLSRLLGGALPEIRFFVADPKDCPGLEIDFPRSTVQVSGEPRWDRVAERARRGNPRSAELVRLAKTLPRPWGVLGSIWAEDLIQWMKSLPEVPGTTWIVPHKIDEAHIQEVMEILTPLALGHKVLRTSQLPKGEPVPDQTRWIVVDELGFLLELYSAANWAYVGGGFGQGVHSTIEPALFGIPISCAAERAETFPEISMLRNSGQLTLVHDAAEIEKWVQDLTRLDSSQKLQWEGQAKARLGASAEISRRLEEILSG